MVWYLLVCMTGVSGAPCLPIQYMKDERECQFVYRQYRYVSDVTGRCIVLKRLPDEKYIPD